jgi:hypothetical protein
MGAPLLWSGASTLLVHNLLLMAGLALTAWTMGLVMFRWTGDVGAAIVAGLLLAFNAHTLTRLTHLQAMHLEFLPPAIYALDRLLVRPRVATAIGLGIAIALQSLTSNYLLVAMAFAIAAAVAVRPREWIGRRRLPTFALLTLAATIASLMLLPFLIPYLHVRNEQGLVRSLAVASMYDASWRDYLAAGGRFHFDSWSGPFWTGANAALFPGVLATVLAGVTVVTGRIWRDPTLRVWMALGIAGLLLSFGTKLPGYATLYQVFPLLQGIRATVRLGYLVLVAIAALAGFGLAQLNGTAWLRENRRRGILSIAAIIVVSLEATRVPLGYVERYTIPTVYRVLAHERDGAVVELPLPPRREFAVNAPYLLNSTIGWWPLVNGYSGFSPPRYTTWVTDLLSFPSDSAIAALRAGGVRYVVIHRRELGFQHPGVLEAVASTPVLRQMMADGNIEIYRVEDQPQ